MSVQGILFWDVDTQVDFIDPQGKLYVPGAENIVENLRKLTQFALHSHVLVVASACAHQPQDPEFSEYPPHCIAGKPGQQKIAETRLRDAFTIPNRKIELPRDVQEHEQIVIEKQQLDVFSNPNTEPLLEQLRPTTIFLYGLVTELCVACAGRGLTGRGYRVNVVSDAVRPLDEAKAGVFLRDMKAAGGQLLTTEEVFSSFR